MVKLLPKIRVKKSRDPSLTIKTKRSSCEDTIDEDHAEDPKKTKKLSRQAAQKLHKERERTARAAAALDDKGNRLFERGHFDKAMVCYSKALKMKRRTFNNMLEDAEDFDANSTKKLSKSDSQVLVSMATSINNIGYLRQRSGEASAAETMAAYQKSLRIKRLILGNDSLSVGKTLNNIGSVHYIARDFEGALKAYSEAMGIMVQNLGEQHPDIATVMSNIGDVHLANANELDSLTNYRSALNIRYANFGKHDPRVVRLLEKIAKIEIGDMEIPHDDQSMMDREEMTDESELKPLQAEYRILRGELKADIEYLDELQKRVSKNIAEENVEVAKDLQDPPSLDPYDEGDHSASDVDCADSVVDESKPVQQQQDARVPDEDALWGNSSHKEALQHVNYRLEKIRLLKSIEKENNDCDENDEEDAIQVVTRRDTMSTVGSNELYNHYYGQHDSDNTDAQESVGSNTSDDVFGQYYGHTSNSNTGLRSMDPNATASTTIRKSKMNDRSSRRVIVTS